MNVVAQDGPQGGKQAAEAVVEEGARPWRAEEGDEVLELSNVGLALEAVEVGG